MYSHSDRSDSPDAGDPATALAAFQEGAAPTASVLARMLDVIDYGVLLALDDGHVVFANKVAREELDDRHPLQLLGQSLRARRSRDIAPLWAALECAALRGLQRMLTLGDAEGESVTVAFIPMSDPAIGPRAGAMLVVGRRSACDDLSVEAFGRQSRLTDAEVRVLKLLCLGRRPADIALAQRVALCTVRTHISNIRDKTGAPSVGDLVLEVTKLPPLFRRIRARA
ncbi:helix-turn-helix transcriptional regulator [Ideonella sp. A 288]|uniref:helix-turn-helix transcriptional regulator n=1 Tax=Ideonella sp. A 288 TaxID=1962181 RepID=UPI001186C112|nr:helix-turn-helix transcriptional regulator [Ideonella sp. A 288]